MVGIAWWDHHITGVNFTPLGSGKDFYPLEAIALVAALIAIARGYTPRVEEKAARARKAILRSAVAVLIVTLSGYIVNTWFFGLGLRIQMGKDSYWTYLTGLTPPKVAVTWRGEGETPLPKDNAFLCDLKNKTFCSVSTEIRFLGASDKTFVLYSPSNCRVYRLRADDVSLSVAPRKPRIDPGAVSKCAKDRVPR